MLGFVLAAALAAVLTAVGAWPDSSSSNSTGRSDRAIALPSSVGSYHRIQDVVRKNSDAPPRVASDATFTDKHTAAALATAHGGAGSDVKSYADADLGTIFSMWAVRDETPAPVLPVENAKSIGLAVAQDRIARVGDASCEIYTTTVTTGHRVRPSEQSVTECQRSAKGLTVTFREGGVDGLVHHPAKVVALVDQVFDKLR